MFILTTMQILGDILLPIKVQHRGGQTRVYLFRYEHYRSHIHHCRLFTCEAIRQCKRKFGHRHIKKTKYNAEY